MATEKSDDYYAKCLDRACKRIERCNRDHVKRVKQYDAMEKAYKAVVDGIRGGRWNHCVHVPQIFVVIETMESGLIDDATITNVKPNSEDDVEGAKLLSKMLRKQMDIANYDEEKGKFTKDSLIYGIGILKTHWRYERGPQTRRVWDDPAQPSREVTEEVTKFDGPMSNCVDPRDFMWDWTATSIDDARFVIYRYWADAAYVKSMGVADEGEEPVWMNVQDLIDSRTTRDPATNAPVDKTKAPVDHNQQFEIHEIWDRAENKLTVIGNQQVLLQDDPSPFWHGELPFQIGMTLTDLHRFEGQSEVGYLIALQNALNELLNQTLDNVELANNAIIQIASDVDDPDSFQFFPGAKWFVDRPGQDVTMWTPETRVLNASQGMMASLKEDLQTVAAALPYLAGAGGDSVDQSTATGIQIISNMAQRRLLRKKALLGYAYKRAGRQWIALNQQFMTMPLAIRIEGPQGYQFKNATPQEIQGDYDFFVESMSESLDRQQKRTEALDLFNELMPWYQQIGLSAKALAERLLYAFDVNDVEQFFQSPQEIQAQQMQAQQQAMAAQQPPGQVQPPQQSDPNATALPGTLPILPPAGN